MNYNYLHYEIGLTLLNGVGPRRARLLYEKFNGAKNVFLANQQEFCGLTGFSPSAFGQLNLSEALQMADKILQKHQSLGVETITWSDPKYPRRLKQCEDAPMVIYTKGLADLNIGKYVAIVGTRDSSNYGQLLVKDFIRSLDGLPITIVSGLAHGIDTMAHQYALESNLTTIAVLGHGHDRIYPAANKNLAKSIELQGSLVTEFSPWSIPDRENFPKRNRIVAGMCDATVVVESRASGGSLITANLANDYNRDVFAFPGNISAERSMGCNRLIANQKAHLITSGLDFLEIMGWKKDLIKPVIQHTAFPNLNPIQQRILTTMSNEKIAIDILSFKSEMSISALNVELLQLEINGLIRSLPGNIYERI